jgi:hypothetical protein
MAPSVWAIVLIAIIAAVLAGGVLRALASFVLAWAALLFAVVAWTEEDPMMVAPGERSVGHLPAKVALTAAGAAATVTAIAWWL